MPTPKKVLLTVTFELEDLDVWCNWDDEGEVKWFKEEVVNPKELCLFSGFIGDEVSHTATSVEIVMED